MFHPRQRPCKCISDLQKTSNILQYMASCLFCGQILCCQQFQRLGQRNMPPPKKRNSAWKRNRLYFKHYERLRYIQAICYAQILQHLSMHGCMTTRNISGILISTNHVNSLVGRLSFFRIKAENWMFYACKHSQSLFNLSVHPLLKHTHTLLTQ